MRRGNLFAWRVMLESLQINHNPKHAGTARKDLRRFQRGNPSAYLVREDCIRVNRAHRHVFLVTQESMQQRINKHFNVWSVPWVKRRKTKDNTHATTAKKLHLLQV